MQKGALDQERMTKVKNEYWAEPDSPLFHDCKILNLVENNLSEILSVNHLE